MDVSIAVTAVVVAVASWLTHRATLDRRSFEAGYSQRLREERSLDRERIIRHRRNIAGLDDLEAGE